MQSDNNLNLASGSQATPQITRGKPGEGTLFPDFSAPADIQALFDASVSRSITQAMVSAMGAVSTPLSQSITQALLQAQQSAQQTDGTQLPLRKRKLARLWKRARAQLESELSDIEEEIDESDKDVLDGQSESDSDGAIGEYSASFSISP
ncbi:Hypothetical predicted protein [Pelobates cultripes]|uniref:Uncharacterized protein n=1 Tax=Pelobates cultripes TaxID=61616 RepID=A0AAD1S1G4_PELCU|nr:Hypothetical predicted protein [Pelobates cultripes]